jgi:subtilisin family serine protease
MTPIDFVRLTALRDRTSGSPDVVVGLIDGPVAVDHPDLANENIRPIPESPTARATAHVARLACMAPLWQEFSPQKGLPALLRFVQVVPVPSKLGGRGRLREELSGV